MNHLPIQVAISLILLVFSAFFSAAETALFSLSKIDRRRLKEKHPQLCKWVSYHLERPAQTLSTILILNLFVNVLVTSMVTTMILKHLGAHATGWGVSAFAFFLIVFCEIMPKVIAVRQNQLISMLCSLPLRFFSILIFPMRKAARWMADRILSSIVHEKKESADHLSTEELKTLVKIGEEEGVLDKQERYMIQKTIELGERPVRDIMTPRVSMKGLDIEDSFERHIALLKQHHHSQFPVYKNSMDNILGFVSVQQYMLDERRHLIDLVRPAHFVPESKRIDDLLTEFRNQKISMAICVDEHGGTAGMVTMEDIVEEIFGEFYDEYAKVENPIRLVGPEEYLVETKISLMDFNEKFATQLESEESSTLGGLILEKLGTVPVVGQALQLSNLEIKVHEVIRQRYVRTVIVKFKS